METVYSPQSKILPLVGRETELQVIRLLLDTVAAATNTEWFPGSMALYGHFLAVTGRGTAARAQLDRAAEHPEPPGFGGDFYPNAA
jgi:hypothetical protein